MSELRVNTIANEAGDGPPDILDHYRKQNILGTVSQSGGFPTGAIIERGSSANGEYVRYADGTQICWREFSSQNVAANSAGSTQTWTYPAGFSVAPVVTGTACLNFSNTVDPALVIIDSGTAHSATGTRVVTRNLHTIARDIVARVTAHGRWF